MDEERRLAETALTGDFFGPAGLHDSGLPSVPEKYVIERRLGQGASGAVFLARDTTLQRRVALKYLSLDRPAEVERFFREARVTARLRHPAIVQVYEADQFSGVPYISMQYVPGGSLASADLDRPATLRVMRQVAEALGYAHAEGIVHRDVKPENILVDPDGKGYVTDFGIARDVRGDVEGTISHDGQILGTPELMSPEQARGDVRAVDARTDVYALGATLYYVLTNQLPFRGETLVDLLHAVIHDEPVFPRSHRPDIPRELEGLVLRCLQKRAADRYGSMRDVIAGLDRLGSSEPATQVAPRWFTTYVRGKADLLDVLAQHVEPPPVDEAAPEREWMAALDTAQELGAWDAQVYRVRDLQPHFPRLDDLIARLTAILEERPSTGWARYYRGVAWFRRGELRRALDDMERSIDRVGDLAGAYFELGRLYLSIFLDEHQDVADDVIESGPTDRLRAAQNRLDQAGIALAEAQRLKHDIPSWQLRYAGAVRCLAERDGEGCVEACDAILADEPDLDEVWKLKGDALRQLKRDPIPAYQRALEVRRSSYETQLAMAAAYLERQSVTEARACLVRALEIHGGLVVARVLQARAGLVEARLTGHPDALGPATATIEDVLQEYPDRGDAVVTLAEIQIEHAKLADDAGWITRALETLQRARPLEGYRGRVEYLHARARLVRAHIVMARGEDPTADLQAVLAMRDREAGGSDREPWLRLIAEAEQARSEYRG